VGRESYIAHGIILERFLKEALNVILVMNYSKLRKTRLNLSKLRKTYLSTLSDYIYNQQESQPKFSCQVAAHFPYIATRTGTL
jgi:hypothetical protein